MRLAFMAQYHMTLAAVATLLLVGCGPSEPGPAPSAADSSPAVEAALPAASPQAAPAEPAPQAPAAPSVSRDPQVVIQAWADAVRARDWPAAYGYWGDHGARSGKTLEQFTAQWSKLGKPLVVLGKGTQEGAAGSSYYTVPVTISDGARRISGEIVLRRVNDVDGASPEQLRWHIDSTTLHP